MEKVLRIHWFVYKFSFKIARNYEFSHNVEVFIEVVVQIHHWVQRIDYDFSTKSIGILNNFFIDVNEFLLLRVTNGTIKPFERLLKKFILELDCIL